MAFQCFRGILEVWRVFFWVMGAFCKGDGDFRKVERDMQKDIL